ncbi:unnamed protein product [Cuscuta campestris]|uniref:Reverse transcriptase zinc-binding domain-containing protein n=1 Tax=Cuscuta campestris TaxID=132261 RepID=A0A484NAQ1_9ASTE|nr:unnamed protein product [Cuscuta campestris]
MQKVMAVCRNFLWSSSSEYKKPPLVKWEEVCRSKCEGGLGLKNLQVWNKACIMKLIWDIASKKDILWVKWVHSRYLKNKSIWSYENKPDDCYYWKKMMLVRKEFAGMPCSSEYTVKEGYKWLAGNQSRVEWAELVWNKTSVPKHQFIAWLIWRGKLLTKDRLSGLLPIDPTCIMCTKEKETVDHLFCSCPFAVDIFLNVSGFIQFDLTSCSIAELGQKPKEGKNMKDRCFIAACIANCHLLLLHLQS